MASTLSSSLHEWWASSPFGVRLRPVMLSLYVLIASLGITSSALADMDYRCLNLCMNDGGASSSCMKKCSYALPPAVEDVGKDSGRITVNPLPPVSSGARQFDTPVPLAGQLILPHPKAEAVPPQEDYSCIAKCQQAGNQYKYCNEQCVKPIDPYSHPTGGGTDQFVK